MRTQLHTVRRLAAYSGSRAGVSRHVLYARGLKPEGGATLSVPHLALYRGVLYRLSCIEGYYRSG